VLVQPPERLGCVRPVASEAERAADDDRPVATRQVEPVQRLCIESRGGQALTLGALTAALEHVRRDVGAVDVEARFQVRDQQAARAAPGVECRLARLDEGPEELDLGAVEVVLRPPAADEPVMPRSGRH